jgi:hypothetical protein
VLFNLGVERWLIVFDEPEVITARFNNVDTQGTVCLHGITTTTMRSHPAVASNVGHTHKFVLFAVHGQLR